MVTLLITDFTVFTRTVIILVPSVRFFEDNMAFKELKNERKVAKGVQSTKVATEKKASFPVPFLFVEIVERNCWYKK